MVDVGENSFQSEQLSRLRRRIAKNTSNSKSVAPHVLTSIEVLIGLGFHFKSLTILFSLNQ